jgi:hypothetical protein
MTSDTQSYSGLSTDIRERLKLRLKAGVSSGATYRTLQRHEQTSNWCWATLTAMGNSAESEERLCARPLFSRSHGAQSPRPISDHGDLSSVVRLWPDEGGCRAFNHLRLGLRSAPPCPSRCAPWAASSGRNPGSVALTRISEAAGTSWFAAACCGISSRSVTCRTNRSAPLSALKVAE